MPKQNARLDAARKAYREALEAARGHPTPEAWAKLLAAGKELSHAEDPRTRGRRGRRRPAAAASAAAHAEPEPEPEAEPEPERTAGNPGESEEH